MQTKHIDRTCALVDYLREHKACDAAHALTAADLAAALDFPGASVIRKCVWQARVCAVPICASHRGYWLSYDPQDLSATLDSLERRAAQLTESITGLRRALIREQIKAAAIIHAHE